MKRSMMICAATATLVLSGAGAANAGEVNGNGEVIPGAFNASSECAFSGLDTLDSIEDPMGMFNDDAFAVRGNQSPGGVDRYHGVQSYGAIVSRVPGVKAFLPSPGMACNGSGR